MYMCLIIHNFYSKCRITITDVFSTLKNEEDCWLTVLGSLSLCGALTSWSRGQIQNGRGIILYSWGAVVEIERKKTSWLLRNACTISMLSSDILFYFYWLYHDIFICILQGYFNWCRPCLVFVLLMTVCIEHHGVLFVIYKRKCSHINNTSHLQSSM